MIDVGENNDHKALRNIEKLDNILDSFNEIETYNNINSFNEIENFNDINLNKTSINDNLYIPKIDMNKCDKSCCKHSQWMPLYMTLNPNPNLTPNPNENYIGSNYSCNGGNGSGCVCITKNDLNFLTKRGYN